MQSRIASTITILLVSFCLFACDNDTPQPPPGSGWHIAGQPTNTQRLRYVVIDAGAQKGRQLYDRVVHYMCDEHLHGNYCDLAFYESTDPIPPDSRSDIIMVPPGGQGFDGYQPIVLYRTDGNGGGAYQKWDCERGGAGAPASALCGPIKQEFHAVGSLAARAGWVTGCGLRDVGDDALAHRYLATFSDAEVHSLLAQNYETLKHAADDGPDDKANCIALLPRIEGNAVDARAFVHRELRDGGNTDDANIYNKKKAHAKTRTVSQRPSQPLTTIFSSN